MATAPKNRSANTISITFSDDEMELFLAFNRNYVVATGDVALRKATLIKSFLMRTIREPKAIDKLARIRGAQQNKK